MFVKPCTLPIPIKTIFLNLKKVFLNAANLPLLRIKIDEKIKRTATNNLKSKRYLNFRAVIRKMTKKGKQNKLYSFKNFLSVTFDLKNCKELIVIETGIKILIVFAKSYPNSKNEGVPNSNSPTPKID